MTSDRHLALMALMRDIEEPSKTYRRSVRLAAALASTSPQWDAAVAKGNAALDDIERAVRDWAAKHPAPELLAEIDRLRAEVAESQGEKAKLIRWHGEDEKALDKMRKTIVGLRVELAEANAAAPAVAETGE
ncbi:hypothetical protein [Streptomyces sp. NBC_01530]|uniref:hypothetical protein n=1 Tax=Streptomyces sp. NBC_01530 TaxID=2903895 RepID=UPI00386E47ED